MKRRKIQRKKRTMMKTKMMMAVRRTRMKQKSN